MENTFDNQPVNDIAPLPQKPQFLRVLCILSFISCGLVILCCAAGSLLLFMNPDTLVDFWAMMLQTQPQLENVDSTEFFHQMGLVSIYTLIANIFSLIGVIMMWRLNKIGFIIYTIAELSVHFFSVKISSETGGSMGGMIFGILLDLVFIILYAVNLKYMTKKPVDANFN